MEITSTRWKEFKEWRKNEILKVIKSKEYKKRDNKLNKECNRKLGWYETSNVYFMRHLHTYREELVSDMPEETIEGCYVWLLDNDKL